MGNQNWQGGPVLAAKIGLGGLFLAADQFFFLVTGASFRLYGNSRLKNSYSTEFLWNPYS